MSISDAESWVMSVLWDSNPQTADDVIEEIKKTQDWSPQTTRTLLNRLLTKGAIRADKNGRKYLYSPVISREDYIHTESSGLLGRLFDGRLAPLVSHFAQRDALSPEDIKELRAVLEGLEDE